MKATAVLVALIGPLGFPELLIILVILVVLFGAKRLSGLGRGLGRGIHDFKKEMKELQEEDRREGAGRDEDQPAGRRTDAE
jgi:sec-independent protein translocase protein TatA